VTSLAGTSVEPVLAGARSAAAAVSTGSDSDGDGLSDAFEDAYPVHLNRANVDTDGDGLLDPAEDPDGDGLSNLAEQAFGTNPVKGDTDGDGIRDGNDDANHDGIMDWREQDSRPVPDQLTPSIQDAPDDVNCTVPGGTDCHGDSSGTTTIAVYGDSHVGQFLPALDIAAKAHHWKLKLVFKSTEHGLCPAIHLDVNTDADFNAECRQWRSDREAELRADPPNLIIVSAATHWVSSFDLWHQGLHDLLWSLPRSRVLLLDDTPYFNVKVPECLNLFPNEIGRCEVPRSRAYRPGFRAAAIRAATNAGVAFTSMNPWVCPYAKCPAIVNHFLLWRDNEHLTVTYSRQLAPAFGWLVTKALQRRPT